MKIWTLPVRMLQVSCGSCSALRAVTDYTRTVIAPDSPRSPTHRYSPLLSRFIRQIHPLIFPRVYSRMRGLFFV